MKLLKTWERNTYFQTNMYIKSDVLLKVVHAELHRGIFIILHIRIPENCTN